MRVAPSLTNVSTRVRASIVARPGGARRGFLATFPRPKNPTCQNLKRFGHSPRDCTVNQYASPISYLVLTGRCPSNCLLMRGQNTKYEISSHDVTDLSTFLDQESRELASGSGASLRATRASTGDGMSLETFEAHDQSPEEVQAARAKADAKRGAPRIPRSLQGMLVLARAFSPPTTDPPVSTQPTPSPHVSTPRSLLHRAHRDRGTPGTRWMRASACFATTPGPSSAKGAGTRSSPLPRAATTAHRRNT